MNLLLLLLLEWYYYYLFESFANLGLSGTHVNALTAYSRCSSVYRRFAYAEAEPVLKCGIQVWRVPTHDHRIQPGQSA